MKNVTILEFAKKISGIFSNKEQALQNPKKFAHIQIHIRPLLFNTFNCYAFYAEQRFQHDIWNPYRQVINKLSKKEDLFIITNHKIENKERFTGSALNESIFKQISTCNLYYEPGCSMHFRQNKPENFIGDIEPGRKCYMPRGKEKIYITSKVLLNKNNLITEDSGYEKETGKKVWGSKFGPLVFNKIDNFDQFIDRNWN